MPYAAFMRMWSPVQCLVLAAKDDVQRMKWLLLPHCSRILRSMLPYTAVVCVPAPVQCLVLAAKDDVQRKEQLVLINTRLLALCTAHDSVAADTEKLEAAAEVYRDLLSSVSNTLF